MSEQRIVAFRETYVGFISKAYFRRFVWREQSRWTTRFTHLDCSQCGKSYDPRPLNVCDCGKPLLARYDLEEMGRGELIDRSDLWRWAPLLPVEKLENVVCLGEGGTKLKYLRKLGRELNMERLYVKDEGGNPTGTFKARGMAVAVSKAKELGITKMAIPTTGSAGSALAAYAKKAGAEAFVAFAKGAPPNHVEMARQLGADVKLCKGYMNDAVAEVKKLCAEKGYFNVATMMEPYRVEGKKTITLEIAEELGELPDVILFPVGGGTGFVAAWKAWLELREMGWSRRSPRVCFVQAEGCAPVFKAWSEGESRCELWREVRTQVSGLAVPKPFADELILRAVRETGGCGVAVSDSEMRSAASELAEQEGISACLEGAASWAGAKRLAAEGFIGKDDTVVLVNTGAGLSRPGEDS